MPDRTEHEALVEALFEEARQRQRRRRGIYATVAVGAALVVAAVLTVLDLDGPAGDTGPAAAATADVSAAPTLPKIAFIRGTAPRSPWSIYLMNADGSGKQLLAANAFNPSWSPDGRRIAFQSPRTDGGDIYVMNADGSGKRSLTRNPSFDASPLWSPDGRWIAFGRGICCSANLELYAVDPDGKVLRRLAMNLAPEGGVSWSPDGSKLAFGGDEMTTGEIYVVNANGSGLRRLTHSPRNDFAPAWSPDGRRILFGRSLGRPFECCPDIETYVMDADGRNERKLAYPPDAWGGAWSPDGRRIVFARTGIHRPGIYVMNVDGGKARRVAGNVGKDPMPKWSPDGRQIAFAFAGPVGRSNGIFVVNADGSGLHRLTRNTDWDWIPIWSPAAGR
jgi:Tol biopolymer transport system component